MGDRHDYVALEWVKGEIADTLKQALADARKPKPCWDCGAVPCLSSCPMAGVGR